MELPDVLEINGEIYRRDKNAPFQSPTKREEYKTESQREQEAFPRDPLAKSMADLVTPKQLGMIRHLAREVGIDPEEECQRVMKCLTDELSKRAASSFIDHLKSIQQEARRA